MSDSFFQKKRKKGAPAGSSGRTGGGEAGPSTARRRQEKKRVKRGKDDEDDDGGFFENGRAGGSDNNDDDDDEGVANMDLRHDFEKRDRLGSESEEDDVDETPAEARVRLAQAYLAGMRGQDEDEDEGGADAAEADRQNISARLQQDVSTRSTHIHNFVADRLIIPKQGSSEHVLATRGHLHSVTDARIGPASDCAWLVTAGKDGQIVRWRLKDGKMLEVIPRGVSVGSQNAKARGRPALSKTSGSARRKMRAQEMLGKAEVMSSAEATDKGKEKAQYLNLAPGQGHTGEIWAMSMSSDGKFLATGGKDQRICIWALPSRSARSTTQHQGDAPTASAPQQSRFLKALGGHRDSITALGFRLGSHDLFTASYDRTLKLFDVSQLSYVETFFGHQEAVGDLDLLRGEVVVSAGLRDRSVRWWKVRDESQLVFRGGAKSKIRQVLEGGDMALTKGLDGDDDDDGEASAPASSISKEWVEGSIDCVAMVDEHCFLSGGDSGTISLWSLSKKKPVFTMPVAHGHHLEHVREGEAPIETPRWITSLACLPYGDVFASGSWDGEIRLWKLDRSLRSFKLLSTIPAVGFVNSLQLVATPAAGPSGGGSKKNREEVLESEKWTRRGGPRGALRKVFSEGEQQGQEEEEEEVARGKVGLIVAAALGQEPAKGRWMRIKEATNGALVVPFHLKLES